MVPQGKYLNLCSCTLAQHLSLHKNMLAPQGNQLLCHSWKTPSILLLWWLHTLVNVLLIYHNIEVSHICTGDRLRGQAYPKGMLEYPLTALSLILNPRVDNKGREKSIEHAIWPVQDVFGKSRTRNSNIDQSECSIQIANSGCSLKCLLTQA